MFSRNSPLKRKYNEFRDPDYPQQQHQAEDDSIPGCSANFTNKKKKCEILQKEKVFQNEDYFRKVRQIIEKEFQREIVMKGQQLEEIDDRLQKAKQLLNRLRHGIVLAYYKKQEIPLTTADAATLKSPYSLFDKEDKGPQMPIHPSVKKLIGKRPKDLSEFMRTCPKRTAAQTAVQTIRAKSQAQKREERKLKKIIKERGIVIDHSKQNTTERDINTLLNTAVLNNKKVANEPASATAPKETPIKLSGKSLNSSRLNNKIKHLIVVGNTSKYIGNEMERDMKTNIQNLTHKWLVYVQSKETQQPIERFIKKVRFYLHRSYRPNDVVDIESPPFQISRRGWGEFPIRVQLFFHSELHQKPVQLIHNIILDKTLSGIQTLGAETLLEIWLRDIKSTSLSNKEVCEVKQDVKNMTEAENTTKPKQNLTRTEELVDENLLDFLNKIESSPCSISADIEKIQPTVLVNEPLDVKMKTPSPQKCETFTPTKQKSPIKMAPLEDTLLEVPKKIIDTTTQASNFTVSLTQSVTSVTECLPFKSPPFTNGSLTTKPMITFVRLPTNSAQVKIINNTTSVAQNISEIPPLRPITPTPARVVIANQPTALTIQKPPIILNKDGKILMASASAASVARRTILPIVSSASRNISNSTSDTSQVSTTNKPQVLSIPTSSGSMMNNSPKQILQKKLVQLVDSTGKVKYIQMLVASSSVHNTPSAAPKIITMAPSVVKNNTVTKTTQITNTMTTPFLRSPNGAHLIPVMTSKPNIFKIVPESMQTKPQILTFSTTTIATTCKNTLTTVNSQQKLLHSVTTTATTTPQTLGQIAVSSGSPATISNNLTIPVVKKVQKPNCNNPVTTTKNLVFQKEGKVYIIDPQQMKYKQQQKKQVSLLKPQISLLKQQQQKLITSPEAGKSISLTQATNNNCIQTFDFGLKQQRINSINALQLAQMKRMLFEKQFLRQEFINMRAAVEFLLRRLKLIVPKDSLVEVFPFVTHTLHEFQSLTAFKQRAHEWLRAKSIARLLRSHKDLQRLNSTSKDLFWSTKEIATFARQYAYTPPIKSLPRQDNQQQACENTATDGFKNLVKSELMQEQNFQYDTLTDNYKVRQWVDKAWQSLEHYEHDEDQNKIIDIDCIEEEDNRNNTKKVQTLSNTYSSLGTYLAPPPHLENQCQLIFDICKDLNVKLVHEELETKVYHPSTQTILAQCLNLFIEKLLRQTIALKQGKSQVSTSGIESISTLMPQDFAKVLASNSEFDFLTNNNFGSASLVDCFESSIDQKKS